MPSLGCKQYVDGAEARVPLLLGRRSSVRFLRAATTRWWGIDNRIEQNLEEAKCVPCAVDPVRLVVKAAQRWYAWHNTAGGLGAASDEQVLMDSIPDALLP